MTTITIDRAVVEQALERLRKYHHGHGFAADAECIASLEAALAQEQAGCEAEDDCTSMPWCKVRGGCQRKQAEPEGRCEDCGMKYCECGERK